MSIMDAKSLKKKIVFEWNYFLLAMISIGVQHATLYRHHLYYYNYSVILISIILSSRRLIVSYYRNEWTLSPWKYNRNRKIIVAIAVVLIADLVYLSIKIYHSYSLLSSLSIYAPEMLYAYMFGILSTQRYSDPRKEVSLILKMAIYCSIELTFYCGFVPLRFFYKKDLLVMRSQEVVISSFLIFFRTFIYILSYLFQGRIGELSIHALAIGKWEKMDRFPGKNIDDWKEGTAYSKGTIVKDKGDFYEALGVKNSGRPDDPLNNLLYTLYGDPSKTLKILEHMIYGAIVLEFVLMFWMKCYVERSLGILTSMFIFFQILEYRDKTN